MRDQVKYFLLGAFVMAVLLLAWKLILFLGFFGLVYVLFQTSYMDFSGGGDGRERPLDR